jgi:hypothetical protein
LSAIPKDRRRPRRERISESLSMTENLLYYADNLDVLRRQRDPALMALVNAINAPGTGLLIRLGLVAMFFDCSRW